MKINLQLGASVIIVGIMTVSIVASCGWGPRTSVLQSQPFAGDSLDQSAGSFGQVALAGSRAVALTQGGTILFDEIDSASPKVVARLPAGRMAFNGHLVAVSIAYPKDAWSDVNFGLHPPSRSNVKLYSVSSMNEVEEVGEIVLPGKVNNLMLHEDILYCVHYREPSDTEVVDAEGAVLLSAYNVADPGNPITILSEVDLEMRREAVSMAVAGDYFALTSSGAATNAGGVIVIDTAAIGVPERDFVSVGFKVHTIGAIDSDSLVAIGTSELAVIELSSSGPHSVVSVIALSEDVAGVGAISGTVVYLATVDEASASEFSNDLIAIDLGAAAGPAEVWSDEFEINLQFTFSIEVDNDLLLVGSRVGMEVYRIEGNEISLVAPLSASRMGFEAAVRDEERLFVAGRTRGVRVFELDGENKPTAVSDIAMPNGAAATTALAAFSDTLYVVSSGDHGINELVGFDVGTEMGAVLFSENMDELYGEWIRDGSPSMTHFGNILFIGMNETVLAIDVSDPLDTQLLEVVTAVDDVIDIEVGEDSLGVPVMCLSAGFGIYCFALSTGNFLSPIGNTEVVLGAQEIEMHNEFVVSAGMVGGLTIASVSTVSGVTVVASQYPGKYHGTYSIALVDTLAFVGSYEAVGIQVYDISNVNAPVFVGYGDWSPVVKSMIGEDGVLIICSGGALRIVDVSEIENASVVATLLGTG